jgi:hypothetical protein
MISLDKKIFVSCPTLDDTEYPISISNAFNSAKNPSRIFFGTAYSTDFKNKKKYEILKKSINGYKENIRINLLNYSKDIGVGYGRLSSMNLYNNEDYVLQVDAHCLWKQDWDEILISLYEDAKKEINYEKILLTGYMPYYKYYDINDRKIVNTWHLRYPFMTGDTLLHFGYPWNVLPGWRDTEMYNVYPEIKDKFLPTPKISAGFNFGGPEFAKEYNKIIPFPFRFFEEELIMTIELLSLGFCPTYINGDIPIAHLYSSDINKFGGDRLKTKEMSDKEAEKVLNRIIEYINNNKNKVKIFEEYSMIRDFFNPDPDSKFKVPKNFYKKETHE